jgi:hypothetical protein
MIIVKDEMVLFFTFVIVISKVVLYRLVRLEVIMAVVMEHYAVLSIERQPTFQRNMSPPSSGLKTKQTLLATCFHIDFLLDLFFYLKMEVICSPRASADLSKVNETRTYL